MRDSAVDISNHSYGRKAGWCRVSGADDWEDLGKEDFGNYTAEAREWDAVVFDKDLSVFKSAGNDRDKGPDWPLGPRMNGPFDCISSYGVAKNVPTIGVVTSVDDMTTFSSWGPADDGRVKPDLIADGYVLRSTMPNNGYAEMGGTSMATPSAAGAGALLFERFRAVTGNRPAAATLKGLFIHGARDLGRIGPDYEFGWGLIEAEASVLLIDNRNWRTGDVSTGQEKAYTVDVASGTSALKATLVWTDAPGTPSTTLALVNNLDLFLRSPSGTIQRPWILNGNLPSQAASRGINTADNVEQASVSNPEAGRWTIVVAGTSIPYGPAHYTVVSEAFSHEVTPSDFTIFNDGTAVLEVTSLSKRDGDPWFSWSPSAPFTIPPGGFQVVTIAIDPDKANIGANGDQIRVYSNDADKSPYPNGAALS